MRTPRLALLILALAAPPGWAQTPIHRCIGADGRPVFTDQPCASLRAVAAPPPADAAPPIPIPAPALTCAADLDELRQATIDAFASGDANRLAGLMLWGGYDRRAVVAGIQALAALMRRPLLGIALEGAEGDASPATGLVVRTVAADGDDDAARFAIERRAGCLWLRRP